MPNRHSAAFIAALFIFVVVAWGLNWVLMKYALAEVSPLWAVAIRTLIAAAVLAPATVAAGQFIVPSRADVPIVLSISLLHMTLYAALMTIGLKYVPAGRAILLGYTTPLWVTPIAVMFLNEPMSVRRIAGIVLGLAGVAVLFNPQNFDWHDTNILIGNGLILLAAICWSISIVYTRAHKWVATPFQLVLWQSLLAAAVLTVLAFAWEGAPHFSFGTGTLLALVYNGAIGTALGYWAMSIVNRELPATTTALGVLATPVIGLILSAVVLHERIDLALAIATVLVFAGIAIGTFSRRR